jgi:hypothetical protein
VNSPATAETAGADYGPQADDGLPPGVRYEPVGHRVDGGFVGKLLRAAQVGLACPGTPGPPKEL